MTDDDTHDPLTTRTSTSETWRWLRDANATDPRITEYAAALERSRRPDAGEAHAARVHELRAAWLQAVAEITDRLIAEGSQPSERRRHIMRQLVQDLGIPPVMVLAAFRATAAEADHALNAPPLQLHREQDVVWLRGMPYEDYLNTEHWKATRSGALERAEGRCQLCGANGQVHVHHRDAGAYARRGQERPADLTVLCAHHHRQAHGLDPLEGE